MTSSKAYATYASFLGRLKIGHQILLGFSVVLFILLVVSVNGYKAFTDARANIEEVVQRTAVADLARQLDRDVVELLRLANRYGDQGDKRDGKAAKDAVAAIRKHLASARASITNPDWAPRLTVETEQIDAFSADLDRLIQAKTEQQELIRDVLDPGETRFFATVTRIASLAARSSDPAVVAAGGDLLEHGVLARAYVSQTLGRHDANGKPRANREFDTLARILEALTPKAAGSGLEIPLREATATAPLYAQTFDRISSLMFYQDGLLGGQMAQESNRLAGEAAALAAAAFGEAKTIQEAMIRSVAATSRLVLALTALGIGLSVALALVLGAAISRPVVRMTGAMKALAAGDMTILVPDTGRRDEIGKMAQALEVFKANAEALRRHRDHLEDMVRERTGQLELAKERAEKSNRVKSTFLASMSHELRTPLNAILGYAQILRPQQNLTARQRQQLDVMHASGEHLLTLISDLLDLSRIEAQKMELATAPFVLPQLLDQAVEITRVRADQKGLELQYERYSALPQCALGDERRVRQILLNLLANAVKFTERGSVTLRVRYDPPEGGVLHCEVADTGIGIAEDKLEAIFDPFTQLTPDTQGREGAGLGLTITRRLAVLMGGGVSVQSQLGRGSTFRFWAPLPPATAAEPAAEPMRQNIRGYRGARRRVLAVDDNPANAQLLVDMLEPLGFEVETAHNGREALRQALEHRPDLVLLDLVMPEMDGTEAAQKMRQQPQLKAMRIVGVSATVTGSGRKQAFTAVCDDFLGKPVRVAELLETMRRLLQLEWEAAPAEAQASLAEGIKPAASAVPPTEVLQALRRAAERGDFAELERLLEEPAEDGAYAAFCQQMQRLATRYDDDGIIAYLDEFGKVRDGNGNGNG